MFRENRRKLLGVGLGVVFAVLLAFPRAARAGEVVPSATGWAAFEIASLWQQAMDGLKALWANGRAKVGPWGIADSVAAPSNGVAGAEHRSGIDPNGAPEAAGDSNAEHSSGIDPNG